MNGWRADRLALIVAAALVASAAGDAFAQGEPASAPTPLTGPLTTPLPPPSQGGAGEGPQQKAPQAPSIQSEELKPIDPATVGTLDESKGGLGTDMWSGTKLAVVQRVLPTIPAGNASPAMNSLARRLLLSPAALPPGTAKGSDLLKVRAERLFAMGAIDDLLALLALVPSNALTPELQRIKLEAHLLQADLTPACADAMLLKGAQDVLAAKTRVLCDALAGRGAEASLGLDILHDLDPSDTVFFLAAESMIGLPAPKLDSLPQATPIQFAALRAAKLPLPADAANTNQAGLLRAIALSADAAHELRLRAAEKAEMMGALDTDLLRQIYSATTFTQQELAQPISDAGSDRGARSRALLFRAAQLQTHPAARAEVIARALSLAKDGPLFFSTARTYAPLLVPMRPGPELSWFAGHAARALLGAGQEAEAQGWLHMARAHATTNPDAAAVAAGLEPLFRLASADSGEPLTRSQLADWKKNRPDLGAEDTARRLGVLTGGLTALGAADEAILPPAEQPNGARLSLMQALILATDDLRLGETIMLSLAVLGEGGTLHPDPANLKEVVHSLRHVGLDKEARALALEAAIAAGA